MGDNLTPVPPEPTDNELDVFLQDLFKDHAEEMREVIFGLEQTIDHTKDSDEPHYFSYGKLINYIGTLDHPELVRILSAALWELIHE
jgi:hypothetical protein